MSQGAGFLGSQTLTMASLSGARPRPGAAGLALGHIFQGMCAGRPYQEPGERANHIH